MAGSTKFVYSYILHGSQCGPNSIGIMEKDKVDNRKGVKGKYSEFTTHDISFFLHRVSGNPSESMVLLWAGCYPAAQVELED